MACHSEGKMFQCLEVAIEGLIAPSFTVSHGDFQEEWVKWAKSSAMLTDLTTK